MAYYNGNHRMVQRQPMMTCPNQAQNRQSSSGYGRNTASAQPCCNQNADTPHQDMPNAAEKKCMMQPRITPADGVAMAYVPFQAFEELFEESKAFMIGTAFPSLFKPFMRGGRCR